MAFTRVKLAGWAFGETLTSAQMNQLDTDHAFAIDGSAGGTYTLSAPLIINSQPLTFGNNLNVGGNAAVTGNTTLTGNLTANGNTTLGNTAGDTLLVVATSTFNNPIDINHDVSLGAGSGNTFVVSATTSMTGPTLITQPRVLRLNVAGDDLNIDYDPTLTDSIIWTTLTADRTATITASPNAFYRNGDHIRFTNLVTTHNITVKDPGGTNIFSLPAATNTGGYIYPSWCDAERISSAWKITAWGVYGI